MRGPSIRLMCLTKRRGYYGGTLRFSAQSVEAIFTWLNKHSRVRRGRCWIEMEHYPGIRMRPRS